MFSILIGPPGTATPKRSSMFASVWAGKSVCLLVAGLVQTDDETIADERDRVGALKRRDVLDPRAAGPARSRAAGRPAAPRKTARIVAMTVVRI